MNESEYLQLADELEALLLREEKNEIECREYIKYVLDFMVPYTGIYSIVHSSEERPGTSGPSDLIIVCERQKYRKPTKSAHIWEIKAAQEPAFVRCNNQRVRPSQPFIKAENQLLHYWNDCLNAQFREEHGITSDSEIHLGGVVISCERTKVSGADYDEYLRDSLYRKASDLRQTQFYKTSGIKIMIWDEILDVLKKLGGASDL